MTARRALITGATGYIGGRLGHYLIETGWNVHAIVRPGSERRLLAPDLTCHVHDGTATGLAHNLREAAPDAVFHLASHAQPEHAITQLDAIVAANFGFGAQLLEAMAMAGCRRMVIAGTYWEFDPMGNFSPNSLYAATKHAFRDLIPFYARRSGLQACNLILYDVYGTEDPRRKFLSLLMASMKKNELLGVTAGEQSLEMVHIEDVVRGFAQAAHSLFDSQAESGCVSYRLDAGTRITLRELVALVGRLANCEPLVSWGAKPYPWSQIMQPLFVGPRLPNWAPRISLEEGIAALLREAGLHRDGGGRRGD